MRAVGLLGLAAEAEAMRIRRAAGLHARALAWRSAAALFGLAATVLLHVAAWHALAPGQGVVAAALVIAAADALIALLLLLAARTRHDPALEEAAALRRALLERAAGEVLRAPLAAAGTLLADTALAAIRRR
jgi:hypothetical protein